jgi:hypothetical protein
MSSAKEFEIYARAFWSGHSIIPYNLLIFVVLSLGWASAAYAAEIRRRHHALPPNPPQRVSTSVALAVIGPI